MPKADLPLIDQSAEKFKVTVALHANQDDAIFLQRFFKTGKGQYGEGDIFIGVRVPQTRAVCKQFRKLPLLEIQILLASNIHEHRLAAVLILVDQFRRANKEQQRAVYDLYMKNVWSGRINNWDIIDSSAPYIVGPWLAEMPKNILLELARSDSVWCRRVAVLGTFKYVDQGNFGISLELAELLLKDTHDLIQKAVGWMLREIGKTGNEVLLGFLDTHAAVMPRTTLRYAIEHLSTEQKKHYMQARAKLADSAKVLYTGRA